MKNLIKKTWVYFILLALINILILGIIIGIEIIMKDGTNPILFETFKIGNLEIEGQYVITHLVFTIIIYLICYLIKTIISICYDKIFKAINDYNKERKNKNESRIK